eukprot:gnl/TRDRNA2_/TRDRNA2_164156_c2_seq2.p1 gnl/TRDRNA2_/TRDRNA2_164156_c2~~gnl/TRDRNA2_/TRDRNA2_164156_c2_seq2.p1  ORF type:complete len:454 (-),score=101.00 gnl/TRDRNA2_/TRDRNA2_164156_c2_seq2:215-1576(-)
MAAEMQQQDTDGARRNSHLPLNLPSIREGQSAHFETLIDPDMGDDCKKFNKQGTIGMESVSTAAPTGSQGLSSWDPSVASMTSPVASMEPGWLDEQDDFFVEEDDTSREALPRPPPGLEIVDCTAAPVVASKLPNEAQSDEGAQILGPPGLELPSKGAERHGTGKCRPCAWFWKPQGCSNGKECEHCHVCPEGEIYKRKKEKKMILRSEDANENDEETAGESNFFCMPIGMQSMEYTSMNPMMLPPGLGSLPSYGSMLHGTGLCKPCAWFWKAKGCQKGQECGHCHICPEGEIKARKRVKVAVMHMTAGMLRGQQTYEEEVDQQDAEEPDEEEVVASSGEGDSNASIQEPRSNEPLPEPLKLSEMLTVSEMLSLSSRGSVLHGTGNCRPCAWFWKPEKCLKDKECNYCHICSEDEIKARKKVKGKAMRMGAIQPLKRGTDSRVPRVLNINAVI